MKTVRVSPDQSELRELVKEAYGGTPLLLSADGMVVKLERYVPDGGAVDLDLEEESPELESELLKGVRGAFTPYSPQDLEAVAEQVRRDRSRS